MGHRRSREKTDDEPKNRVGDQETNPERQSEQYVFDELSQWALLSRRSRGVRDNGGGKVATGRFEVGGERLESGDFGCGCPSCQSGGNAGV
jgi:hypothetical protein